MRARHKTLAGAALALALGSTAPDLAKLVRSVGDSLTASGLIKADGRIVALRAMKIEVTGWTGATISVHEIGNEPADEVIW